MRIGLDLDNTIVCYDRLFYEVARERRLVPESISPSKIAVRQHIRQHGDERDWTRLQGVVYGTEMHRAPPYPGFGAFVEQAVQAGHVLSVVSHRTRTPYLGPDCDLHAAAGRWLSKNAALISSDSIYFESTREAKLERVAAERCEVFVDDLPELLVDERFPDDADGVWFNPQRRDYPVSIPSVESWGALSERLGLSGASPP